MRASAAIGAMLAVAMSCAASAQERASCLPRHLPLGQEACFGRVYDAAHLRKHPKQRVTELFDIKLGSDDRIFRLQQSSAEACTF